MSPSPIPSFDAVCGLISTHVLHIAVLIGSGISCIHGRCAVEPSRNACDEKGRKWNGYCAGSPSNTGGSALGARDSTLFPVPSALCPLPLSSTQPCFVAVDHASSPPTEAWSIAL